MTRLFLSHAELVEMTNYKKPSKQAEWLAENGYKFDIRSDGRPNVLRQQVIERQCQNVESTPGPDLSAIA